VVGGGKSGDVADVAEDLHRQDNGDTVHVEQGAPVAALRGFVGLHLPI
jgi:hypothetical protein